MKPEDHIYVLVDRFNEVAGVVVSYDAESGLVVVRADDDGELLTGYEEYTRPYDDEEVA